MSNMTTADILGMPAGKMKDAAMAQLRIPVPNPTPVVLRKPAKIKGEMNKTEQAYAMHLQAQQAKKRIEWFGYEVRTLRLDEKTTYTPDFWVILPGGRHEFHEVKGRHTWEDSVIKFKWAAQLYPYARFVMLERRDGTWWERRVVGPTRPSEVRP